MQTTKEHMLRDWEASRGGAPLHNSMTFTQKGLVFGRGTMLAAFEKDVGGGQRLDLDEPRILALADLARLVGSGVIETMRRAVALWLAGDTGLAQIYLALRHTVLPPHRRMGRLSAPSCREIAEQGFRPRAIC